MSTEGTAASLSRPRPSHRSAGALWIAIVVLVVALVVAFAVSVPWRFTQLATECPMASCPPAQLGAADFAALSGLGIPVSLYAGYITGFDGLMAVGFLAVAGAIAWRRPDDRAALLSAFLLATLGMTASETMQAHPALGMATVLVVAAANVSVVLIMAVFPDGRLVQRWMLPVLVAWTAFRLTFLSVPAGHQIDVAMLSAYAVYAIIGFYSLGAIALIQRYRSVSSPIQRQQTKWVVFGFAIAVLGVSAYFLPYAMLAPLQVGGGAPRVLYLLVVTPLYALAMLAIPMTIAISIGRHRLWDIDLIINRTFVYVSLTAILGGLFSAMTTLSQRLFVALTGEKSDAAVVATTLVVVALFTPVKGGLQAIADRRFKEPARPGVELKRYVSNVRDFVEMIDPELAVPKLLARAVAAFGSTGGAAYLDEEGELRLIDTVGDRAGGPVLSVPLEVEGSRVGLITLGPRKTGQAYPPDDIAALQDAAAITAHAATLHSRLHLHHGPADQDSPREHDQLAG